MNTNVITGWQLVVDSIQNCEWTYAKIDFTIVILLSSYDEIQHVIDSVYYILCNYRSQDRPLVLEWIIQSMISFNNETSIVRYIYQLWPEIIRHSVDISSFNYLLNGEGYQELMRLYAKEKLLNGGHC